ncbi:endonuclease/exonuclease/phosphatase family protein [Streptomyces sp. WMMC897]|uniref:endonuclease/exonuclease/phosphatase family protein n=1 Tax=Streptomyces sp. WMMC897 TaxID=3014782 RepID=UPI0022B62E3E|nr:endonuclease/exonuclease/phosphatase family protein [Streptomyces sp. WMMC897]MCZ7413841.1 endonuclease/exonuclease/phosphatase family protein [Streptomyces sp. WMMC897]
MTPLADLPESRTEADGSAVVRLLSYNIRAMRDDVGALVRVIRACAPDVVCVQEAPRFFRWRTYARRLARRTELVHVTGGATACGPMILSSLRATVEEAEDVLLPRTPGLHRRGLATAVLRFGERARLSVVSCHLSLAGWERTEQAELLLDRLARMPGPVVAAGDLNERPDGPAFTRLAGRLRDGWAVAPWGEEYTSTARRPHQRIDAVLAGPGAEVLGCGVPAGLPGVTPELLGAASDHRPVLAALRLP